MIFAKLSKIPVLKLVNYKFRLPGKNTQTQAKLERRRVCDPQRNISQRWDQLKFVAQGNQITREFVDREKYNAIDTIQGNEG